jgi:hypothetical protein
MEKLKNSLLPEEILINVTTIKKLTAQNIYKS